jgi:hypothetical protein
VETKARDLLYLLHSRPHRATSNGPTLIHLSFGIRRPTGLNFVDLMIQRFIADITPRGYVPCLSQEDGYATVQVYLDYVLERSGTLAGAPILRSEFLQ